MLSITDLLDFIDLDRETVDAVQTAVGLPLADAARLAGQLLATEKGIVILHHMFRDQIAEASAACRSEHETELRRAYAYFARKYPLPHIL